MIDTNATKILLTVDTLKKKKKHRGLIKISFLNFHSLLILGKTISLPSFRFLLVSCTSDTKAEKNPS